MIILTLKWSLFSSSLFISVRPDSCLNFKTTNFYQRQLAKGIVPGEKPRGNSPSTVKRKSRKWPEQLFPQKIKVLLQDSNTRNQCWKLGRQRNCFQLIWTLQLEIYCLIWPPGYHACFLGKRFLSSCSWISRKKWPPRGDVYIAICFLKSSCL